MSRGPMKVPERVKLFKIGQIYLFAGFKCIFSYLCYGISAMRDSRY